jgi:hypothetical protein
MQTSEWIDKKCREHSVPFPFSRRHWSKTKLCSISAPGMRNIVHICATHYCFNYFNSTFVTRCFYALFSFSFANILQTAISLLFFCIASRPVKLDIYLHWLFRGGMLLGKQKKQLAKLPVLKIRMYTGENRAKRSGSTVLLWYLSRTIQYKSYL